MEQPVLLAAWDEMAFDESIICDLVIPTDYRNTTVLLYSNLIPTPS